MTKRIAVVVLSGGQDSTTCLAMAIQQHGKENVYAVTFDYGQRHRVEIAAAEKIASLAGISHEVVALPQGILRGTSPLVNPDQQVELYASASVLPGGLEKTFVPMRNQLFLTLAANRAVVIAQEQGARHVELWTGVSQEDYGGYPDCRHAFIDALESAIKLSLDDPALPSFTILTPLMYVSKKVTVDIAMRIGPDAMLLLSHSHTCYNGEVPPCGHCHACLLRQKGFDLAGIRDPLLVRLEEEASHA